MPRKFVRIHKGSKLSEKTMSDYHALKRQRLKIAAKDNAPHNQQEYIEASMIGASLPPTDDYKHKILMYLGEKPAGYIDLNGAGNDFKITDIFVAPEMRKKGEAGKLLEEADKFGKEKGKKVYAGEPVTREGWDLYRKILKRLGMET